MTFAPFDVVVVPFPYSDRLAEKRRPARVISAPDLGARLDRLWVAMITSAGAPRIHGDAAIDELGVAGLSSASILRASKIATIDASRVLRLAGRFGDPDCRAAAAALRSCAGF